MTDAEMVELYRSGWSFGRIELASGKSLNYIRKRLRDAGIKHRPMGLPKGYVPTAAHVESLKRARQGRKPSLGMVHSEETRRKMSETRRGAGNARWIDGRKQTPYPPEWTKQLRSNIRKRQNCLCAICDETNCKNLHVHHIDHNKQNCRDSNLVGLCFKCHGLVHRKKTAGVYGRWLTLYVRCRDAKIQLSSTNSPDFRPSLVSIFKAGSHKYWQSFSS